MLIEVKLLASFKVPNKLLGRWIKFAPLRKEMGGDKDLIEEWEANSDSLQDCAADSSDQYFVLERSEDYEAELNVDVDKPIAVTDQTFRGIKKIIEADAKTNLLDDFVCVFGIDIVFNSLSCIFAKVFWGNLDEVRDLGENEHDWL